MRYSHPGSSSIRVSRKQSQRERSLAAPDPEGPCAGLEYIATQRVTNEICNAIPDINRQSLALRLAARIAGHCQKRDVDYDPIPQDQGSHRAWRPADSGWARRQPAITTRLRG